MRACLGNAGKVKGQGGLGRIVMGGVIPGRGAGQPHDGGHRVLQTPGVPVRETRELVKGGEFPGGCDRCV